MHEERVQEAIEEADCSISTVSVAETLRTRTELAASRS